MCIICKNKYSMKTICKICKDTKFISEKMIETHFHLTKPEYSSLFTALIGYQLNHLEVDVVKKFNEVFANLDNNDLRFPQMTLTKTYLDKIEPGHKTMITQELLRIKFMEVMKEFEPFKTKLPKVIPENLLSKTMEKYQNDSSVPKFIAMKVCVELDQLLNKNN